MTGCHCVRLATRTRALSSGGMDSGVHLSTASCRASCVRYGVEWRMRVSVEWSGQVWCGVQRVGALAGEQWAGVWVCATVGGWAVV